METEILYGRNPVVEAATVGRKIFRIWLTDKTAKALKKPLSQYRDMIEVVSKARIGEITGRGDHQGAAAEAESYRYYNLKALSELPVGIILALDGITDPRNLGATIRSAVLLDAKGVIIPEKNSAQITPVVCHTSAGATEHIAIIRVKSLAHVLKMLKTKGFTIAGAEPPGKGSVSITGFNPPKKLVLVMGSEGSGLRSKVRSACDTFLHIPQHTDFDSFNVSVAASILLWELMTKNYSQ